MTTKEQERKVLEQIKKIVASLGDDSYIGIAFQGVLEDAATNIENDFGNSQYERAERYLKERDELAELANARLNENIELTAQIENLKAKILTDDENRLAWQLATRRANETLERIEALKEEIVNRADEPGTKEFRIAVMNHRQALKNIGYYSNLAARLESIARA